MKANLFAAAALSICVIAYPLKAASYPVNPSPVAGSSLVKIDLNSADVKTLTKSFKGIGQKRAEAIVQYRDQHGKFNTLEELQKVKGFGRQFVQNHLSQLQEVFSVN